MAEAFRTPEERFDGLPDFPFGPEYVEIDGLRLARVDEGNGSPSGCAHDRAPALSTAGR